MKGFTEANVIGSVVDVANVELDGFGGGGSGVASVIVSVGASRGCGVAGGGAGTGSITVAHGGYFIMIGDDLEIGPTGSRQVVFRSKIGWSVVSKWGTNETGVGVG